GQLTVSGAVMPMEEQLAVAESLRRVGGCSCVVSKLDPPDRVAAPHSLPLSPERKGETNTALSPVGEGVKGEAAARAVERPDKTPPLPERPGPASLLPAPQPSAVSVAPTPPKWEPVAPVVPAEVPPSVPSSHVQGPGSQGVATKSVPAPLKGDGSVSAN